MSAAGMALKCQLLWQPYLSLARTTPPHDSALTRTSAAQMSIDQNVTQGLIAGGTYTGGVYVWDLSQEGDFQVFKSTLSASSHQ